MGGREEAYDTSFYLKKKIESTYHENVPFLYNPLILALLFLMQYSL